ncbi:MAG: substrate-binding domain-containing protein [Candidatus Sumerlaeaceae bacterium]|nr:substrate-binding domain-containing protein [Candidatus Sumerlaeaceae bacterium]
MNIRIVLVLVSLVLSLVTGIVLSRGGSSGSTAKGKAKGKVVIGFSMDTLKEERWQADKRMFTEKAEALGAEVLVQSANSDDVRQVQDIEALISRNVDVLVIIPHNAEAMATGVEKAHQVGIPVISYDRLIKNADVDLYISFDNYRVGEEQAKALVALLPGGKGKIIRIYGAKTDNNAAQFKEGQDRIILPLVKSGDIQVIHEDWTEGWKPENAKRITQAAIAAHGTSFDGILASNDGTAGGAIQTLTEEGLAGKIPVTGQDAELSACQRIIAGTQAMTIYKPIHVIATAAAGLAVDLARRKPIIARTAVPNGKGDIPTNFLDIQVVTKDNMRDTIIRDNYHPEAEVYKGAAK